MANNYFQFKQFTIQQDKCAMKVCTDSCLFGSVLPIQKRNQQPIQNALDIGTGTGLLSLMYAQLNPTAAITALELETNAYEQAVDNITSSKFAKQINVINHNFLEYKNAILYDLIFCNPPFYENDLQSNIQEKNIAHHSTQLTYSTLIMKATTMLQEDGILCILIPQKRAIEIEQEIEKASLVITKKITVHQNEQHKEFRVIYFISTFPNPSIVNEVICIKENEAYSEAFIQYLQPFYLNL